MTFTFLEVALLVAAVAFVFLLGFILGVIADSHYEEDHRRWLEDELAKRQDEWNRHKNDHERIKPRLRTGSGWDGGYFPGGES